MYCIVVILFLIIILILLIWWFVILNAPTAKYVENYKIILDPVNELESDVSSTVGRVTLSPSDKCLLYKILVRGLKNRITSITFTSEKGESKDLVYQLEKNLLIHGSWKAEDLEVPLTNDHIRDFQIGRYTLVIGTTEYPEGELVGVISKIKT